MFRWQRMFKPLIAIWHSLPKALPEDNQLFWLQNQWWSSLGGSLGSALAQLGRVGLVRTNTVCFLVCSSCCKKLLVCLRKNCQYSCNTILVHRFKKVLMLCKFQAVTSHLFFFMWKEIFNGNNEILWPNPQSLLCSIFWSFIGLWVNIGHGNKSTCS